MEAAKLKEEILIIKERLDKVESDLKKQIKELEGKEKILNKNDLKADLLLKNNSQIITFNICGKKFMTRMTTLLKTRDTLFYRMIIDENFDPNQEIFMDTDPKYFELILDFLRTNKIYLKSLSIREIKRLRQEAVYFEVEELLNLIGSRYLEVEFESFEFSGPYISNTQVVGTNILEDISNQSLNTGICARSPGWITIKLDNEYFIEGLDIGGYRGNQSYWSPDHGSGAPIKISLNNTNWTTVSSIPSGFGSSIQSVKFNSVAARYIKFEHGSYLGIGYLKLHLSN